MIKCNGETIPQAYDRRFEQVAEDFGEIKQPARQAVDPTARTNGHAALRLGGQATLAVRVAALVAPAARVARRTAACVWAAVVLLTVTGCQQHGRIVAELPTGERVVVTQQADANEPATLTLTMGTGGTQTTTVEASTGCSQPPTPAMIAAKQIYWGWIIGGVFAAVGVGALILRRWFKVIPTSAVTLSLAIGAGFVVLSIVLPSIPIWVWTVTALAAVGVGVWVIVPGLVANRRAATAATGPDPPPAGTG